MHRFHLILGAALAAMPFWPVVAGSQTQTRLPTVSSDAHDDVASVPGSKRAAADISADMMIAQLDQPHSADATSAPTRAPTLSSVAALASGAVQSASTTPQGLASPVNFSSDTVNGTRASLWPQVGDTFTSPDVFQLGGLSFGVGASESIRCQPYGFYDTGACLSVIATDHTMYASRPGIDAGYEVGMPALANNGGMDSVAVYEQTNNVAPRIIVSSGVTYDKTHIRFATPLTVSQTSRLRKSMWVLTNSVDKTVRNINPPNTVPTLNTYGSYINGWTLNSRGEATAISIVGWTVPGSGHAAPGQVPSTTYDTYLSQIPTPTVFIGAPTTAFGRNLVLAYQDPLSKSTGTYGSMTHYVQGEEMDLFNYSSKDYDLEFQGYTVAARMLGTVPAANGVPAHAPKLDPRSYDMLLAGPTPNMLEFNGAPTSNIISGDNILVRGQVAIPHGSPIGAISTMSELSKMAGATDSLRWLTWLQAADTSLNSWQDSEYHMGLFVDGRQGGGPGGGGTQLGDIVFDPGGPTGHLGGISLRGYGVHTGLIVEGSGALTLPSPVTAKSTITVDGNVIMATPGGATGSFMATDKTGAFYVGTAVSGGAITLSMPTTIAKDTTIQGGLKVTGGAVVAANGLTAGSLTSSGGIHAGADISTGSGAPLILRTPAAGNGGTINSDAKGDIVLGTQTPGGRIVANGMAVTFATYTYALLPRNRPAGSAVFCTDCRKTGETAGAGTGALVVDDGHGHWLALASSVAAH